MVKKLMVEKLMVAMFMVEEFMVEKFIVEEFMVEEFMSIHGWRVHGWRVHGWRVHARSWLKSSGLKFEVENFRVETLKKPHACEICGKSYPDKTRWREHVLSHDEKNKVVYMCSSLISWLLDHMIYLKLKRKWIFYVKLSKFTKSLKFYFVHSGQFWL